MMESRPVNDHSHSDEPLQSDSASQPKAPPKADSRAEEAAAVRRRWITLGETLAVLAVVISGLTLWNNWTARSDREAAAAEETLLASTRAGTLVLVVASASGDELKLLPASSEQTVQSQEVLFPGALGLPPAATTGQPRIEAAWFEHALKKARSKARLPDDSRGDERLPVVLTTRFLAGGELHENRALYDIGYSISGHWLGGHSVALRGISLAGSVKSSNAQARLDARWRKLLPQKQADRQE